ncbi:hypothetical protein [Campylobacter sputorum]|uniref:hypothetical protein n=1 Tax=Campylobacter sputorum TaxID=206 RepID=UPI00053BDE39|nr:hypothetical protein [Campylobacter sputorum]
MSVEQILPIIISFLSLIVSIGGIIYTKTVEQEKSRLKKVEALFSYRYEAVQEFNKIYQEIKLQDCSTMEDSRYLYLNNFLNELRVAIKDFIVKYSQILNNDIVNELNALIKSIDEKNVKSKYLEDTDSIYSSGALWEWLESKECDNHNKKILNHIENTNKKLKEFLLKETKQC